MASTEALPYDLVCFTRANESRFVARHARRGVLVLEEAQKWVELALSGEEWCNVSRSGGKW